MERQEELELFIKDAAAFLRWALRSGRSNGFIVTSLAHDIFGLAINSESFSLRVSGYAMKEQEVT